MPDGLAPVAQKEFFQQQWELNSFLFQTSSVIPNSTNNPK
jgi:hypothetical protein